MSGPPRAQDPEPAARRRALPLAGGATELAWSREVFDRNVERAADFGPFTTAVLVVMQPCEMHCRFCPRGDGARSALSDPERHFADLYHQLAAARSLGVESVVIAGDDVFQFPGAVGLFHAAGRLGFRHICAQSPGRRLADPRFAGEVAHSPLDRVELPIHGASAGEHDEITRAPGSFDDLCRAVDQCLSLGRPQVELHTIALPRTQGRLGTLLDFGKRRFGLDVHVGHLPPGPDAGEGALPGAAPPGDAAHNGEVPFCALPDYGRAALSAEPPARRRLHLLDLGLRDGASA